MKDQNFLPKHELKAAFDSQKEKTLAAWEANGVVAATEALSKAIKDLQDIGLDVQLKLGGSIFEDAFPLAKKAGGLSGNYSLSLSGILKVDHEEFLLTICEKEAEKSVLKIYLSERDFSGRTLHQDYRGSCFNLNENPEAIHQFQDLIMQRVSQNEVIRDHDVCDAFENNGVRRLRKSVLNKPIPKP